MKNGRRQPFLGGRIRHIHMVGIGGIGMSSIAAVLLSRGYRVSGSDLHRSDVTENLERLGASITEGHSAANVEDADVVVYSSAVDPETNEETREAARRHIPLINRSVMLAELMRMKFGIGVAGTHGKTTTTTLVGLAVGRGGFDPTIVVGGKVAAFESNAVIGEGDVIVIEADEYDRTFLRLTPAIAVITTIDADHLDIYDDLDDIKDAFVQFANSVPFFGSVIVCLDDSNVQSIVSRIDRRIITYGLSRQAEVRADNVEQTGLSTRFTVHDGDEELGELTISLPGRHNVRNALAAVAVGREMDVAFEDIKSGLESFTGIQRRFERLAETSDLVVVSDYAHHPAEVVATIEAARNAWPDHRLVVVFQPHLYSRTLNLADDFARAFLDADVVIVTSIYGAREEPIPDVTGELVAEKARKFGHRDVEYVEDLSALPQYVMDRLVPGDRIVVMGAGNVWRAGERIAELVVASAKEQRAKFRREFRSEGTS